MNAQILLPSRWTNPTWLDAFPELSGDVVARLKARRIRSVSGAVRVARKVVAHAEPIGQAIPRMRLDSVLDREAAHLLLMLQVAADAPDSGASTNGSRSRRAPASS